jgi:hypothetical protein
VDVDERQRMEGREADEAGGDADRLVSVVGEEDERGRMAAQAFDQPLEHRLRQRRAVAEGVERDGVGEHDHVALVLRVGEVGRDDAQGGRRHQRASPAPRVAAKRRRT